MLKTQEGLEGTFPALTRQLAVLSAGPGRLGGPSLHCPGKLLALPAPPKAALSQVPRPEHHAQSDENSSVCLQEACARHMLPSPQSRGPQGEVQCPRARKWEQQSWI